MNTIQRIKQHQSQLQYGRHCNIRLTRAWKKYGRDAFQFEVIALIDESVLRATEQRLLDRLVGRRDCYNRAPDVANGMKGLRHSDDAKAKQRKAKLGKKLSPESIAKRSAKRRGVPLSAETRAKISAAQIGKFIPLDQRQRMRVAQIGKKQSPETIAKRVAKTTGQRRTLEQRAKIGAANKGWNPSPETRARMSAGGKRRKNRDRAHIARSIQLAQQACIGKPKSPEHRAKISAALKGKALSPERREKIREFQNRPEVRENNRARHTGRKQSPETVAKRIATIKANRERKKANVA